MRTGTPPPRSPSRAVLRNARSGVTRFASGQFDQPPASRSRYSFSTLPPQSPPRAVLSQSALRVLRLACRDSSSPRFAFSILLPNSNARGLRIAGSAPGCSPVRLAPCHAACSPLALHSNDPPLRVFDIGYELAPPRPSHCSQRAMLNSLSRWLLPLVPHSTSPPLRVFVEACRRGTPSGMLNAFSNSTIRLPLWPWAPRRQPPVPTQSTQTSRRTWVPLRSGGGRQRPCHPAVSISHHLEARI